MIDSDIVSITKQFKNKVSIPIIKVSKHMDILIDEISNCGGGILVVGYDSKHNDFVSTKDFYCEKVMQKCKSKHIEEYKRIQIKDKEIFCILIS